MNEFVVLEGLSGVGKTTIGRLLAAESGAEFYKTPPTAFLSIREGVDRKADHISRFLFYLAGVFCASGEIEGLLKERPVVCDRYILTTLCYHRAIGTAIEMPESFFSQILQPTHVFLVVCDEGVRRKRLVARGLSYNDATEEELSIGAKFLAEYRRYSPIEIDNSSDDPSVAVRQILAILREG